MTNLVQWSADSSFHLPDGIWNAHWDGRNTTVGDPYIPDALWPHRRIHQYRGDHRELRRGDDQYRQRRRRRRNHRPEQRRPGRRRVPDGGDACRRRPGRSAPAGARSWPASPPPPSSERRMARTRRRWTSTPRTPQASSSTVAPLSGGGSPRPAVWSRWALPSPEPRPPCCARLGQRTPPLTSSTAPPRAGWATSGSPGRGLAAVRHRHRSSLAAGSPVTPQRWSGRRMAPARGSRRLRHHHLGAAHPKWLPLTGSMDTLGDRCRGAGVRGGREADRRAPPRVCRRTSDHGRLLPHHHWRAGPWWLPSAGPGCLLPPEPSSWGPGVLSSPSAVVRPAHGAATACLDIFRHQQRWRTAPWGGSPLAARGPPRRPASGAGLRRGRRTGGGATTAIRWGAGDVEVPLPDHLRRTRPQVVPAERDLGAPLGTGTEILPGPDCSAHPSWWSVRRMALPPPTWPCLP